MKRHHKNVTQNETKSHERPTEMNKSSNALSICLFVVDALSFFPERLSDVCEDNDIDDGDSGNGSTELVHRRSQLEVFC